ncbi:MAG: flavin reductase family protein [Defluviitaleaceae bacterium]|nr:flavin reductase family protein [Defluviitaleaceae bacterium]
MKKIEKRSISQSPGLIPQAVWLIGTRNGDGTPNLSTITWVSYAYGPPEILVVSMQAERTKDNILRAGEFTANLCTVEMARLADYVGSVSGRDGAKDAVPYGYTWGEKVHAPVLDASPLVAECKVLQTHTIGDTHTFFAEIVNQQIDCGFGRPTDSSAEAYTKWLGSIDACDADPLLYTWKYYRLGKKIANLGELAAELSK